MATTSPLFDVADTSRLWLTLNVRQDDARYVTLWPDGAVSRERQRERAGGSRHRGLDQHRRGR